MDAQLETDSPVPAVGACSPGCRYAEPLRDDYHEWLWCTRPGAAVRIRQLGSECAWANMADAQSSG